MSHRSVYLTIVAGLAMVTVAATTATLSRTATSVPSVPSILATENFGSWRYTAVREGGNVTLETNIADTTAAGLDTYRVANEKLALELAKSQSAFQVNVILKNPISVEALDDLIAESHMVFKASRCV